MPTDPVSEKARNLVQTREHAQRPLPNVPVPVQAYQVNPVLLVQPPPQFQRTPSQRAPSQTHKRRRTMSQGQPPLRGILKNKGQTNAPPMQASGGFDDYTQQYVSQSWPSASSQPSARGGYASSQLDQFTDHYPSAKDYHYAHAYHGANVVAPQVERRRTAHASTSRGRPQYQPSDSPVSDDSEQPNNDGPPVAVLQVRASNYISAYVKPVRMKPEAYHLNWPLKLAKPDRHGKMPRRLYFDIAFDPRENEGKRIRICDQTQFLRSISKEELQLPVTTHCVLTSMTITHNEPQFAMWPIKVHRKEGIRCIDVFAAIYETFHMSLKPEDGVSEEEKKYADRHRQSRCQDASGLFEYNWRQGLLRVDILRSRRIFAGLEQDGSQWKLQLNSYMAT